MGSVDEIAENAIYSSDIDAGKVAVGIDLFGRKWPNAEVPYEIDPSFSDTDELNINIAINEVNTDTSVFLRPRSGDLHYVRFIRDDNLDGGLSYVGYQHRAAQEIWFQPDFDVGGMIRECQSPWQLEQL